MKTLIIWILLLPAVAFTQTTSDYGRSYSDTIPQKYILDVAKLRDQIYVSIPNGFKKDWNNRISYQFANTYANNISDIMGSGEVYSDWELLENYLNEILKKVIPKELKNDSLIHAYILQDGNYNASMTPAGYTFINIGLLPEMSNEAEIAGVLAHELAHYYLKHSLQTFLDAENGEFNQGFFVSSKKVFYHYSQKHELQADSLAIRWLQNSGYNLNGFISFFETEERLEKNVLKRSKDEWKLKATTHPVTEQRLKEMNKFLETHKNDSAKYFLVDENKFNKFKEASKPEILKIFLNEFNYSTCLEHAFRFHIFDPDNSIYTYYLMESIRRKCYLNTDLWGKMFITDRYYDTVNVNGMHHKEEMKDNLFTKFDLEIIPINPADGIKIKTKYYWKGEPKFTTYDQAYNFFYKESQRLNNHECILSNALSYTHDKDYRNKLLEKYLTFKDIQHREFAENLLAETTTNKLSKNKLLVFHDYNITVRLGKEDIPIPISYSDQTNPLPALFDSVANKFKDRKPLFAPGIKNNKCNDYKMLVALEQFSLILTISKGEKTEIQILDPRYWETLNKYKVNEIEFLNCLHFESHPQKKTLEDYKRVTDADYKSFFAKGNQSEYLYVYISSVRQIEGKVMKIRYYSGEDGFSKKESTTKQIISFLKKELNAKEKAAEEIDYRNKKIGN